MTPHEVLGVAPDASRAEIRAAYRVLVQIFHPDRHATSPKAVQQAAAREMTRLNEAYAALTSRAARKKQATARTDGTGRSQDSSRKQSSRSGPSSRRYVRDAAPR